METLAIKYRPHTFDDVTEQGSVKTILENQIESNTIKHGYLFCGGAGTGKTTCARIFANEINNGEGEPIELDAASNNSVDDIRRLTTDAETKSLYSEYKVFIIDECHSLSNQAWQAMLKTLEEPPAKAIYSFCTTNPVKIPATILSRVQRYNFQRISQKGVLERLEYIVDKEGIDCPSIEPLKYITKIADGGLRDAITLLDKCTSYSNTITMNTVVEALGVVDYDTMFALVKALVKDASAEKSIEIINKVYADGKDVKVFIKDFFEFVLDMNIFSVTRNFDYVKIPNEWEDVLTSYFDDTSIVNNVTDLLNDLVKLNATIKWEQNAKAVVIADFILFIESPTREYGKDKA